MSEHVKVELKPFEKVVQVYSGHPGCACGCQGTYWPNNSNDQPSSKDLRNFRRIYKLLTQNLSKIYSYKEYIDEYVCLDIPETNRTYTIYYK